MIPLPEFTSLRIPWVARVQETFPEGTYANVLGLCKTATLEEIVVQEWSLNPGRYVGLAIKLTGQQYQQLAGALLSTFSIREMLDQMLYYKLGKRLSDRERTEEPLAEVVFNLIGMAEAQGWTTQLIEAACESNPRNPELLALARQFGLALKSTPKQQEFERVIQTTQGFLDITNWRTRLGELETQVCRVEIQTNNDKLYGTGFLIGPDVVITSYHMMKDVIEEKIAPSNVFLRFDYKRLDDDMIINSGTVYLLAKDWLIDWSPTSPLDLIEEPQNAAARPDELDYVLLRTSGSPGTDPVGGKGEVNAPARNWIKIFNTPYTFQPSTPLIIMQYPRGDTLKLALDTDAIIGTNANHTRVFYKTNTAPGSSGSPCFNSNWDLVAIHQGKFFPFGPDQTLYNVGIPLTAILALLEKKQLTKLLQIDSDHDINIGSSVASNYNKLETHQKRYFTLLGVFAAGKFDVEAVVSVWNLPDQNLVKRNLLSMKQYELVEQIDEQTYSFLPGTRDYALSLLQIAESSTDTLLLHTSYYLSLTHKKNWKLIESNYSQIEHAWKTLISINNPLMYDYLEALDDYFIHNKLWSELLEWSRNVRQRIEHDNEPKLLLCLNDIGIALMNLKELEEALEIFMHLLDTATQVGNKTFEADAYVRIGSIYKMRDQYARSLDYLERGRKLLEEMGDQGKLITVLIDLGLLFQSRSSYERAKTYFEESLTIARKTGDRAGEIAALNALGSLYYTRNQLEQAFEHYQESLVLQREIGDRLLEARTLNDIGNIYKLQDRLSEARHSFEESLHILKDAGSLEDEAKGLHNLGKLFFDLGDLDNAFDVLAASKRISSELHDLHGLVLILNDEGLIFLRKGDYQQAKQNFEGALGLAREINDERLEFFILMNLGQIAVQQIDWYQAQEHYEKGLHISEKFNDRSAMAIAHANLGTIYASLHQWEDASVSYQNGKEIAHELGDRTTEATMLNNLPTGCATRLSKQAE